MPGPCLRAPGAAFRAGLCLTEEKGWKRRDRTKGWRGRPGRALCSVLGTLMFALVKSLMRGSSLTLQGGKVRGQRCEVTSHNHLRSLWEQESKTFQPLAQIPPALSSIVTVTAIFSIITIAQRPPRATCVARTVLTVLHHITLLPSLQPSLFPSLPPSLCRTEY